MPSAENPPPSIAVRLPKPARPGRDCVLLLILALIPAVLTGWFHPRHPVWSWSTPGVAEVGLDELGRAGANILWVDARPAEQYAAAHIPGALPLNEDHWEEQLPAFLGVWQPNSVVVVYCDSSACQASQAVARRLQRELGLTNVRVLRDGWSAWQKAHP